jgi:diguanylate cyclase (GGDEF)-like protein/PAS domain S-box-containing protein
MNESDLLVPLLQNASLLLAMVVICSIIGSRLSRESGRQLDDAVGLQVLAGFMMGLVAIAIILTPVGYTQDVFFDTRSVLISLTALFFGPIPAAVAMALAALFRLYLGGTGAFTGTLVILSSGIVGLLWRRTRKPFLEELSFRELYLFGIAVHVVMLGVMLTLPRAIVESVYADTTLPILLIYPLATVMVGSLLVRYLREERNARSVQKNEQRLRLALAASDQELLELNLQTGHIVSVSAKDDAKLFQKLRYHASIHTLFEDMHPDDAGRIGMLFKEMAEGLRTQWQGEFRMRKTDGEYAWFYAAGRLVAYDAGRPLLMLGTYVDITERKQNEENLRIFRALVDHTQDAIEVADPATGRFLDVNASGCQELGYTREELLKLSIFDVDRTLHPKMLIGAADKLRSGELQTWEGEHVRKDGTTYPVEVSLKYVQLSRAYIVAVVRNIAERRKVEEDLKLAALVYENSHEAMMVMDVDTNIIDVNPTFTTITGYDKAEVVGKKPGILRSGRQTPEFYDAMWEAARTSGHWSGEIWNMRKGGQVYPEWLELNAVRDGDGKMYRYVAQSSDISDKKSAEHQIWRQANYDKLTGLPNRSMFHDRLEQEIKRGHRGGTRLALLFLDLDRFKEVNDSMGHDMGDLLLKQVAGRLAGCVRESDTIARLGGDEFIIILNDLSDPAIVSSIAEKITSVLAAPFNLRFTPVYVSASVGITLYPDDGDTTEVLLKNADQAMYTAKNEGRNRFYYFTPVMQEQVNRRTRIISEMRLALRSSQFHVVYQPVVDLRSGAIVKAEALVRWHHPVDGPINPGVFIPLAEEAGLVAALGNFVFRDAIQMAKRFLAVQPGFMVSVNKSPAQFDSKEYAWLDILKESGLDGGSFAVEITEGLLLDLRGAVRQQLQDLRNAGMQIALDDFGTGYSSLAYLKKVDINYLKIDQSFIRNLVQDRQDQVLCDAMITMAHGLGMLVIAEGVETGGQRDLLMELGCDYGQGYLFSKPVSGEQVLAMLEEQAAPRTDGVGTPTR